MKNSLLRSRIVQETWTPVNITTPVSRIMAAEMPSTPRTRLIPPSPRGQCPGRSSHSHVRANWRPPTSL